MDHKALTQAKFLEILTKAEATEDVQLTKVELRPGAEDGQNYSGQVVACRLEANVKDQPKIYNWMAKVPFDDAGKFVPLRLLKTERFMNIGDDGYKYVESYKRFAENVIDPIQLRNQLTRPDACRFNVLCHGDPWFNNMLFRYEDQNPTDVCLVDLARTKWASPTIDLSYFLFISTTPELRQAHMNEILEYYHQCLSQALKELGEDPSVFSLRELKSDYKKCSFFGFMMSMTALPILLARKEDVLSSEEMIGDLTDPDVKRKFAHLHSARAKASMTHEPQIGHRISGGFMEMVENGYFTL
ncbi:uncharacterized protein LOC131883918 isoform X2 [Tigriopus californicus]|uniref:uncharacterized protein LOC131883918 isoform X2 n=1 Tax=Tigriopus californicus TaxID=6832 RepID=UPI0027DA8910|nr:uncharacterized protein LOC131883918 isoform X2 [Tigriopus californicus]